MTQKIHTKEELLEFSKNKKYCYVESKAGCKFLTKNGLYHSDDSPAIIYDNYSYEYYTYGALHNTNGIALFFNIPLYTAYYYEGKFVSDKFSDEEFQKWIKLRIFS